jgi:hypothetical protein
MFRSILLLVAASVAVCAQPINVTASPNPVTFGQPVTLTAAGQGTGTVVVTDNGHTIGTAPLAGGQAVLTARFDTPGIHPVRASLNGATAAVSVSINASGPASFTVQKQLDDFWSWHDLNGDGLLDRMTVGASQGVTAQLNLGNGSFGPVRVAPAIGFNGFNRYAVGDLNSDERGDFLYYNFDRFVLLTGRGDGGFGGPETLALPIPNVSPAFIKIEDMNGDGHTDLIIGTYPKIYFLIQTAPKTFVLNSSVDFTNHLFDDLVLGDINGDGRLDAVTTNVTAGTCYIVLSSGQGWIAGLDIQDCTNGLLADVNRDGRADFIGYRQTLSDPYIIVRLARPDGTFGSSLPQTKPNFAWDESTFPISIVDWNKDGNPDVLVARTGHFWDEGLRICLGSGDGMFACTLPEMPVVGLDASSLSRLFFADLNGDSIPDMAPGTGMFAFIGTPVSPPSGGQVLSQTGRMRNSEIYDFRFTVSDPNGARDIAKMYLLVGIGTTDANSCYIEFDPIAGTVRLREDSGAAWGPPAVIGPSYLNLSNSRCRMSMPVSASLGKFGPTLSAYFSLSFLGSFTGDREVYARAIDLAGNDSGFQQISGVLIRPPLSSSTNGGVSPSFALGVTGAGSPNPTYQLMITDADGRYDTTAVVLRIGQNRSRACAIKFDLIRRTWDLFLDDGLAPQEGYTSGTISNSQCSVDISRTSLVYSDKTATITIPVQLKPGFSDAQPMFITFPDDSPNLDIPIGVTGTSSVPLVKALSPLSGTGPSVVVTADFGAHAWAPDLYLGYILFLHTPNIVSYTARGTCLIEYNRISNGVRLIDDPGTGWIGPISGVPIGPSAGSLSNSVCTVNVAGINITRYLDSSRTVSAPVTFKENFQGVLGTFLQAFDVKGNYSGMTQFGNWTAFPRSVPVPGPAIDSFTQSVQAGSAASFSITASHTAGATALTMVHLLIGSAISDPAPCQAVYFPASNTLNLINDSGTALVASTSPVLGLGGALSNSRCTVYAGAATRTTAWNSITLNLPVTFTPAFAGRKTAYAVAFDNTGLVTHWVQGGPLNVQ